VKRKPAKRKRHEIPQWAKVLLKLVPPGTAIIHPRDYQYVDPVPEPKPDFTNAWYLEQISLGRWIGKPPGDASDEMAVAFRNLAELIASRAENYLFPSGASEELRKRLVLLLEASYSRGFYLALVRYRDDLRNVPEAAAMLESLRRNSAKGAAARRKQAAPTHRAIQKRFRELRKTVPKKTARYLRIAGEFGMSDRHVARIVDGIN
jgi:hypothetical protein